MPVIEPLCDFCIRVPLDPQKLSFTSTFTLGSLSWIKDSRCPFCRLLNLVYYEDYRTGSGISRNSRYTEPIILCWAGASGPGKRGAFYVASCPEQWICFAGKSDTNTFVNDACFLRPLLHSDLDISRIARWISICETVHSGNCVLKTPEVFRDAFIGLNGMRLVDVYQNCLVEVQDLRQYVALSYMWGAVPNFRLTASNRNQLLLQGSIDKIWEMIPRTIQDAITLVRKLELRYLWVDALCLLQNDWQDIDRGVNVMDQVYE
jgi:Heterokaryon incompatibility protein (HET)